MKDWQNIKVIISDPNAEPEVSETSVPVVSQVKNLSRREKMAILNPTEDGNK